MTEGVKTESMGIYAGVSMDSLESTARRISMSATRSRVRMVVHVLMRAVLSLVNARMVTMAMSVKILWMTVTRSPVKTVESASRLDPGKDSNVDVSTDSKEICVR
jgi:hypothetical protein